MFIHTSRIAVIVLVTSLTLSSAARAQDAYTIASGKVSVVCPLTVGSSFEAKTNWLHGKISVAPPVSGAAAVLAGNFQVDLHTLETGIGIRDRHMRDYLQVERGDGFSTATFDDLRIEKLDGKTTFTGTLTLHGQHRHISGTAQLQQRAGSIRVQAQFPLRMSEFQIPNAVYLGIGVRDDIQVSVTLTADLSHFAANTSSR